MKKRVGIITLNGGNNYGNVLQNYAVQSVIEELGLEAETIINDTRFGQYYPRTGKTNKFTPKYIKTYVLDQLNYRHNIKNSGSGILKTLLFCRKNKIALNHASNARKNAFDELRNELIHWGNAHININKPWNKNQIDKYDYFVSGSDQVWNPTYPMISSINFLQFAPKHKRITFSPSFGIGEIPDILKENYSNWLNEIPHLSVREEQGKIIIKELCGRDATVLCDPTMCLSKEKWLSIAKKPVFDTEKPYILTYFLGNRTKQHDKYIGKIARENGLHIIHLFDVLDLEHYATSPQELLYLINNAKLVCTDSFHGTVFSIIMKTDFVTFTRVESGKSMNSRIETLLSTFGLQDRNYKVLTPDNLFSTNFSNTDSILVEKRKEAFDFLEKALNSAVEPEKNVLKDTVLSIKEDCCGCTACESACPVNCITMVSDSEGFKYPKIDLDKCVGCKKCEKICPAINKTAPEKAVGEHCFIGYSKNPEIRKNSSSGGIFYHLAQKVIDENGVVFGAAMIGREVRHTFADTKEQLKQFMGSKYVQSDMGDCFKKAKEFLDLGRRVLFSGTPCQIKGLYAYLGKNYPNLLTQDFICHGVPSPKVWANYVCFKTDSENPQISFRDKRFGWHYFSMKIKDNKRVSLNTLEDDWFLRLFLDNTILRPSCYSCKAKKQGSSADITIADCWSPRKVSNTIKDTDEGLSLILINSTQGRTFFEELLSAGGLFFEEADREKALASQAAIITKSARCNPKRAMFFDAIGKVSTEHLYKNWYKTSILKKAKKKWIFYKTRIKRLLVK